MASIKCEDCGLPFVVESQYCERAACQLNSTLTRNRLHSASTMYNEIMTNCNDDDAEQQIPCMCGGAACYCAIDTVLGEFNDAEVNNNDIVNTFDADTADILTNAEDTTADDTAPADDLSSTREYIRADIYESFNDAYNKFNRIYGVVPTPYELSHMYAKRIYITLVCASVIGHFVCALM